jgi:hypothetical protein
MRSFLIYYLCNSPQLILIPALYSRIYKYASCSNECFILALIYIDRLIQRNNFLLTELNVHRVVITAILLAAKFFDDAYYNNAYYAKVGGVLVSELNSLEVEFLFRINFSLRVAPDVFEKYNAELSSHASSMGLQAQVQQYDALVQGYSESVSISHQGASDSLLAEADTFTEPFVYVEPPTYEIASATQEAFYQQPQVGVNCASLENPPHITPSPPPHPPHVQGSISYASDLAGAMYEPYPTTYYHQHAGEMNGGSSDDMLLIDWPQVHAMPSTSPGLHYQERSCSQSHQGHVVPQHHQNYDYVQNEFGLLPTSDYGGQHFVSSPGNQYVNYSPVES